MNYTLNKKDAAPKKLTIAIGIKKLIPAMHGEYSNLTGALIAILLNSGSSLIAPVIIAHAIDADIIPKNYHGLVIWSLVLLGVYIIGLISSYYQTKTMGGVGRRVLYNLRESLFKKLQDLPVAFFNQNKSGDLISRINNDTDKLNQFFAQGLIQLVGNSFLIVGAGIFLVALDWRLGLAALVPAALALIVTQFLSPWIKRTSKRSLVTTGLMSAEVQESLANFRVIVAFNRLDYFRTKFAEVNQENYDANISAGIASNVLTPIYSVANSFAQLFVLAYGILLIISGHMTIGLLVGFFLYVNSFYQPLRQLASLWSSLQLALASIDRVSEVLELSSDMLPIAEVNQDAENSILAFKDVSFKYPEGKTVLHDVSFELGKGKTYALVGPTGGGKTTTASLMARLYDPTTGCIFLDGKDIRSYEPEIRTKKIGFILQEPFLFTGTVAANIVYGNEEYKDASSADLMKLLQEEGLDKLVARFEEGLDTKVGVGDSVSLGQKQLIAFIRAVLRRPDLLILDEATANIDTVTEQLLQEVLEKLPATTTRVIIAHRLNTIENADEIFFVNGGTVVRAGSVDHALDLLMHGQRQSSGFANRPTVLGTDPSKEGSFSHLKKS